MTLYEKYDLIISISGTFLVIISTLLVYHQVKIASKAWQLEGVKEMQRIVLQIQKNCEIIYGFPLALAAADSQFAKKPPTKHNKYYISDSERRRMQLTKDQILLLNGLSDSDIAIAKNTISLLNNIGQLVEDGYVSYAAFLGKTHCTIIRVVAILEPIRQKLESDLNNGIGGNYGHRLLRLRKMALIYNQVFQKHRDVPIFISNSEGHREIVPAYKESIPNKLYWTFLKIWYRKYLF